MINTGAKILNRILNKLNPTICGLLTAGASLVVVHGLQGTWAQQFQLTGYRVWAQQLWHMGQGSCPMACGIFLGQGTNPCPLYWQADS